MQNTKQLVIVEPETKSGLVKLSHGGTLANKPPLRIASQFIRDFTVGMLNYEDHVVNVHGETDTQSALFSKNKLRAILDLRTMSVRELRVYIAILERQGYDDKAVFKSLNDICKMAGMDKKTMEVKSILETLRTNTIYIADTNKKPKKPKWTKVKFIESIDTSPHTFRNIYRYRDKSKLESSSGDYLEFLSYFNTRQHEQASRFFLLVMQRITEKRKTPICTISITEIESKVFYRAVISRNKYRHTLKACFDAFVELNFIESYVILDDQKTILLNICGSPNTRKSSPNTRKSSPNTRKSSPNTRRPPSESIDFIG